MVTSTDGRAARALVELVVRDVAAFRSVRFPARAARPDDVIDALVVPGDTRVRLGSHSLRRHALLALLEQACAAGKPIVLVVDDADRTSMRRLERLRARLECVPEASAVVRIVLVGTPRLLSRLEKPSARNLAERVISHVKVGDPEPERNDARPSHPGAARRALAATAVAAVALLALTSLSAQLTTAAGMRDRLQPVPPSSAATPAEPTSPLAAARSQIVARPAPHPRSDAPLVRASALRSLVPVSAIASPSRPTAPARSRPVAPITRASSDPATQAAPVVPTAPAVPVTYSMPAAPAAPEARGGGTREATPRHAALVAPAPTPRAAPPSVAATPSTRVSHTLQVASLRDRDRALALRDELARRFGEVRVVVFEHDGASYHRVRIGRFESAAALSAAETALREEGYAPVRFSIQAPSY